MRCPVCRAELSSGPTCRRCRADLSLLFALEDQRQELLRRAAANLARGQGAAAANLAHQAVGIHLDADALRLRAAGALLCRDYAGAWRDYLAWRKSARTDGEESPGL